VHVPQSRCSARSSESLQIDGHCGISYVFSAIHFSTRFLFQVRAFKFERDFLERCKTYFMVFLLLWWSSTISGASPKLPLNRRNSILHLSFFVGFELLSLPINKKHENAQTHWLIAHPSTLHLPHSTHRALLLSSSLLFFLIYNISRFIGFLLF